MESDEKESHGLTDKNDYQDVSEKQRRRALREMMIITIISLICAAVVFLACYGLYITNQRGKGYSANTPGHIATACTSFLIT